MSGSDEETMPSAPVAAGPAAALAPGTLLNGIYRIEQRLGAGGMGEVYRATNIANEEQDAVKIIGRGHKDQALIEAMFRKEARVLSRIRSPAVAQLKLFARDPDLDLLYFITDFVPGDSVLERLRRQPGAPDELRALLRRVLTGLQAVHEAGSVHRDLSPDNIILPGGDVAQAKLIDFGIAKELDPTHTTMIGDQFAGKLGYIAPEQLGFSGSQVGPWTDLYSLALVGIAFAAGKPLDMGATIGRAEEARRGAIDLSALPHDLRPVFARLLTYDWQARPRSAAEVLTMLDQGVSSPAPVPPPPPTAVTAPVPFQQVTPAGPHPAWPPSAPPPRQGGSAPAIVAIVLAVLLVAMAVGVYLFAWPRQPSPVAVAPSPTVGPAIAAPTPAALPADQPTAAVAAPPGAISIRCGGAISIAFGPNASALPDGVSPLIGGAIERAGMCRPAGVVVTGLASTREQQPFDLAQRRADTIASALRGAGIGTAVTTKIHIASPDDDNPANAYRQQVVEIGFIDR